MAAVVNISSQLLSLQDFQYVLCLFANHPLKFLNFTSNSSQLEVGMKMLERGGRGVSLPCLILSRLLFLCQVEIVHLFGVFAK